MSSWASIEIGGMSVIETQNYYTQWYFRKSERSHTYLGEDVDAADSTEDQSREIFAFKASVGTIKKRLELAGFTKRSLQLEFNEQRAQLLHDLEMMLELTNEPFWSASLEAVREACLDDWIEKLELIWEESRRPNDCEWSPEPTGDQLFDFMITNLEYFTDRPSSGGFRFPCISAEAYALALMEFMPEDTECVLDITALVEGGWTNDFDDLLEYQCDNTIFYEVFVESMTEIHELKIVAPNNLALTRLLYASVITAMETYLSDTFKKQILNKDAIRRRFIKHHDAFKAKISLSEIYEKMETLKEEIVAEIDKISFHNLDRVIALYKHVLATDFPAEFLPDLRQALGYRHDIVHRNGKSTTGTPLVLTIADVNKLIEIVDSTIYSIDKGVKDTLLDDIDV